MRLFLFVFLSLFQLCVATEQWERVRLVSFPCSGNHWVRNLVEEATGIVTTSCYPDSEVVVRKMVAPWGGYFEKGGYDGKRRYPESDEPALLMSHYPMKSSTFDKKPFTRTIRLVRNPYETLWAHAIASGIYYRAGDIAAFIESETKKWANFQLHWNKQSDALTIRFEDLVRDPESSLRMILDFYGYEATDEDIARAVAKYPPRGAELRFAGRMPYAQELKVRKRLRPLLRQFGY